MKKSTETWTRSKQNEKEIENASIVQESRKRHSFLQDDTFSGRVSTWKPNNPKQSKRTTKTDEHSTRVGFLATHRPYFLQNIHPGNSMNQTIKPLRGKKEQNNNISHCSPKDISHDSLNSRLRFWSSPSILIGENEHTMRHIFRKDAGNVTHKKKSTIRII